ncbi:MAG: hypothetical protein ABI444_14395 [Candidatus Kapaibacterium sp.]|jgi:hypothetical protein
MIDGEEAVLCGGTPKKKSYSGIPRFCGWVFALFGTIIAELGFDPQLEHPPLIFAGAV